MHRQTASIAGFWLCALTIVNGGLATQLPAQQQELAAHAGQSSRNMVASVHPIATEAGLQAFSEGGNAVDAAVATALTLGVVDGFNSGIGGGCFVLIRSASGEITAIDGREMAPRAAHRDMFIRDGSPDGRLSTIGPLACGVPGALAAYAQAVQELGLLKFDELIDRAGQIAAEGFEVDKNYSQRLQTVSSVLKKFDGSRAILLRENGKPWRAGDVLVQKDLANTYQQIAKHGVEWFYDGEFARTTEAWMKANGGILTAQDFANYRTVKRKPVTTTYRGFTVIGFPPPSSGGVHIMQILNILESFDLKKLHGEDPAKMLHVVAEAMKLAFADRAYWLGDPDFVNVPTGLVDKSYARQLAARIDPESAIRVESHGMPPGADSKFFEKHTTFVAAADKQGNWVAINTTVNTTFGSKVIVPGLGVVMNNQMDDFSIAPGVPNAFGLIGGENNAIAPGKRPLSSMSPTIVLKNGVPVMTVGAAGGPKIITQALLTIVNHLDLGMPLDQAVAEPRIHHQWAPDQLLVEKTLPQPIADKLRRYGHRIRKTSTAGITQAISFDPVTGLFTGVHDSRISGKAAGL